MRSIKMHNVFLREIPPGNCTSVNPKIRRPNRIERLIISSLDKTLLSPLCFKTGMLVLKIYTITKPIKDSNININKSYNKKPWIIIKINPEINKLKKASSAVKNVLLSNVFLHNKANPVYTTIAIIYLIDATPMPIVIKPMIILMATNMELTSPVKDAA
jgi:hypothetical protein